MENTPNIRNASKSLRSAGNVFLVSIFLQLIALTFGLQPTENYERVRVVISVIGFVQVILSVLFAVELLTTAKHLEGKENSL